MTLLSDMQTLTGEIASRYIDPIMEALNEVAMDLNEEGLVLLSSAVGEFMSGVGMLGLEDMQSRLGGLVAILEGEGELDRRLFEFKEQFQSLIRDLPRREKVEVEEISGESPEPDVPAAMDVSAVRRYLDSIHDALNEAAMDLNEEGVVMLSETVDEFMSGVSMLGLEDIRPRLDGLVAILEKEEALDQRLYEFKQQFEALIADIPGYSQSQQPLGESAPRGVGGGEDESVIRRFTEIPGVGGERARMLYRAGFTSLSALADASVARLFRVEGISLSLARDIADYLNPERFMDMEIMTRSRPKTEQEEESPPVPSFPTSDPETAAELEAEIEAFFSGPLNQEQPAETMAEQDVSGIDEDPELLIMFIDRFRTYVGHIGRLIDSVGQDVPSPVAVEELIDVSRSLAAVSKYMGFSHIGEEAVRVTEAAGDLGRRPDDRDDASFDVIRTAHTRLISDLERLKLSAEGKEAPVDEKGEETLNTLMTRWRELDDLYTQVGKIIDKASATGSLDDETRKSLKGKTTKIDEVASSLSALLDKVKE
jgi:hypothetical protein